MEIIITTCIGLFVIRDKMIIDKVLFKDINDSNNVKRYQQQLLQKFPQAKADIVYVLPKAKEYTKRFYEWNMYLTRESLKKAISRDHMISHCINCIDELNKAINLLVKRLREWYSLYFPELDAKISNNDAFARLVLQKEKNVLLKEFGLQESIGGHLAEEDIAIIKSFAEKISLLIKQKEENELYLEKIMDDYCPNLKAVGNTLLAAQLLAHSGSLAKLAGYPSSTIQILGAEKALFRHMKTKARSPKHGIIINHSLIAAAKAKDHGKVARKVAAALSIAAKIDYFKGDKTIGKKLRDKLEMKK